MIVEVIEGRLAKDRRCIVECDLCKKRNTVRWWGPCYLTEHKCRSCATTESLTGSKRSEEAKKNMSIAQRKLGNGGIRFNQGRGYKQKIVDGYHPRKKDRKGGSYVFEHILVIEEKLGRFLEEHEIVHHIDENKQNNSIDNLFLCSGKNKKESTQIHNKCHQSAENLTISLLKKGLVEFVDGEYKLKENIEWITNLKN